MLHVILAILSLLLLAGVFNGMSDEAEAAPEQADEAVAVDLNAVDLGGL